MFNFFNKSAPSTDQINLLKRENQTLKQEIIQLKAKLDISEKKEELSFITKDPLDFYDIIIDINSLKNVKNDGWEIIMNENGKKMSE